jgi:C4-dicarboxylate transporter DctQ subunit
MIWLAFNLYFVYLSYDFIFNRMNVFWKSQTTGIPMKYIYLVLPIAFALMSIRIIQVNYLKLVKGVAISDPDSQELENIEDHMRDPNEKDRP